MVPPDLKEEDTPAHAFVAEDEEALPGSWLSAAVTQWTMFVFVCTVFTSLCAGGAVVSWHLGIMLLGFFLFFAFALAVNIEHAGIWQEISKPLWVLVCLLVGCFGTWLSICVVGTWEGQEKTLRKDQQKVHGIFDWPNDLEAWVADETVEAGSSHTVFKSLAFFGGFTGDRLLMRTMSPTNATAETAQPGMSDAHSFTEYKGDLFFFAKKNVKDQGEHLWRIQGAQPTGSAVLVKSFTDQEIPRSLTVWNKQLFFKVYVACGSFKTWTHYVSDGTAENTRDENSGHTYSSLLKACSSATSGTEMRPPRNRLYGVLFIALLPSTCLAILLLYVVRTGGVVLNILGGLYATAMLIYILIVDDLANLKRVFEVSALMYASGGYGLFGIIKLQAVNLPEWVADLTDWALVGMSVAFFGAISLYLGIPNTTDGWKWAVYAAVQLVLVVLGLLVKLALPVVLAGLGLSVVAVSLKKKGVKALGTGLGPQMELTMQLAATFILGLLVLAAGTLFAFQKARLEAGLAVLIFGTEDAKDEQPERPQQSEMAQQPAHVRWEAWSAEAPLPLPGGDSSPITRLDLAALSTHDPRGAPDLGSLAASSSSKWSEIRGLAGTTATEASASGAVPPPPSIGGVPSSEDVESLRQLQGLEFRKLIKLQTKLMSASKGFAKLPGTDDKEGSTVVDAPTKDISLAREEKEDSEGEMSEEDC